MYVLFYKKKNALITLSVHVIFWVISHAEMGMVKASVSPKYDLVMVTQLSSPEVGWAARLLPSLLVLTAHTL